jgi:phosphate acetyltransferase
MQSMNLIERFKEKAKKETKKIVFPEGDDERIREAAFISVREGIAEAVLIGKKSEILPLVEKEGLKGITVVEPDESEFLERFARSYSERKSKVSENIARRMVRKPLFFASMMVAEAEADGMVAGAAHATASVIQTSLAMGFEEGISTVSSFFIMVIPECLGEKDKVLIFADSAVNIKPTPEQLADIAVSTARSAEALLNIKPRVAMLSFSTKGSAASDEVEVVVRATRLAQERFPDLAIDGEFQADTALVERVAAKKVKELGEVAGKANVLIFPDLNSGNIAYKLTQYLANAQALGPFLQGLAFPVSDLSRGATVENIVGVTAVIATLAQKKSSSF